MGRWVAWWVVGGGGRVPTVWLCTPTCLFFLPHSPALSLLSHPLSLTHCTTTSLTLNPSPTLSQVGGDGDDGDDDSADDDWGVKNNAQAKIDARYTSHHPTIAMATATLPSPRTHHLPHHHVLPPRTHHSPTTQPPNITANMPICYVRHGGSVSRPPPHPPPHPTPSCIYNLCTTAHQPHHPTNPTANDPTYTSRTIMPPTPSPPPIPPTPPTPPPLTQQFCEHA